jgi:NADPH:quinone reductase-like Zn-dependent oxidoreductase
MRAVTIVEGSLKWKEHPDPQPGPGEILVAVAAAGINAADIMQRQGFYPAPPGFPQDIPGMEFAGEVVGLGEGTTRFVPGERVMSITGGGAQAELAVVAESVAMSVPASMEWDQAGGFPEAFYTAHDALFTQAHLRSGERVLISGAAGGVGTAAVQLAHSAGAYVVASVRSSARRGDVAGLGAEEVIDPADVSGHGPYDVCLELVGASGVEAVLPVLAMGGRIVVIGVSGSGAKLDLNLLALMGKRAAIGGSMLRGRTVEEKAAVARALEEMLGPRVADGAITVPVAETIPIDRATDAYERFEAGGKFGKIVLVR